MSDDITALSATEMAAAIREKRLSAQDVTTAHLARIEEINPTLNSVCTMNPARSTPDTTEQHWTRQQQSTGGSPRASGLPPFYVPVPMLVLARFLGRADPAVAHQ